MASPVVVKDPDPFNPAPPEVVVVKDPPFPAPDKEKSPPVEVKDPLPDKSPDKLTT